MTSSASAFLLGDHEWIFHCQHPGHTVVRFVLQINFGTCFIWQTLMHYSYFSYSDQTLPSLGFCKFQLLDPYSYGPHYTLTLSLHPSCSRHNWEKDTRATTTVRTTTRLLVFVIHLPIHYPIHLMNIKLEVFGCKCERPNSNISKKWHYWLM